MISSTYTIDPKSIAPEDVTRLYNFFKNSKSAFWPSCRTYTFSDGTKFKFKHNVVKRLRKNGEDNRFEFISENELGRGFYGRVLQVEGTLALVNESKISFKPHGYKGKGRVVKSSEEYKLNNSYQHMGLNAQTMVVKELQAAQTAGHLGVKSPVVRGNFFGNDVHYFMIMRHVEGISFENLLKQSATFTRDQKIAISVALLKALKEQVLDKGLVHRDLKPDNIFVQLSQDTVTATIIDFGFSKQKDDIEDFCCGAVFLMPPEMLYDNKFSPASDIFSMGRILSLLWGANDKDYDCNFTYNKRDELEAYVDKKDFKSPMNLPEDCKDIEKILINMVHIDASARCSIDDAISLFNAIVPENHITFNEAPPSKPSSTPSMLFFSSSTKQADEIIVDANTNTV